MRKALIFMKLLREFFLNSLTYEQYIEIFENNRRYYDLGKMGKTTLHQRND